jgi:tRNA(fMet)-specific endonuclease VapC
MEVVYGLRRKGRDDRVALFEASLAQADVLTFDEASGRLAGRIISDLERRGRPIGMPDVMIATIAINHALPVVTGNVAHYEAIRDAGYLVGVENWPSALLRGASAGSLCNRGSTAAALNIPILR